MSVSRHDCWKECQQKYKFRYHLKTVVDMEEPIYFLYGSVVHKIAEEYVLGRGSREINDIARAVLSGEIELEKRKPPTPPEKPAVTVTEDGIQEVNPNVPEPEPERKPVHLPPEYQRKLPAHLRAIKSLVDRTGFDGYLEWDFKYDLDPPHGKFVVGFIDRLIVKGDKIWIIDYKTTKKGFWRKGMHNITSDLQLKTYCKVVQRQFNLPAENIKAALFFLEGAELVGATFTQDALDSAEATLLKAYNDIVATHPEKVYGNVGRHCSRCDFRKLCPFYSLT